MNKKIYRKIRAFIMDCYWQHEIGPGECARLLDLLDKKLHGDCR